MDEMSLRDPATKGKIHEENKSSYTIGGNSNKYFGTMKKSMVNEGTS